MAKTTYSYDAASRLKTVSDGTNTAAYSYLANSPLVGNVWFTNNTTLRMTTSKAYDYLNRLTGISSAAGGSNVAVFNYAYNAANQRTAITNVDSSRWVYTYDLLGQVTGGKKYWSDGTPVAGQHFEYGFDDIGNRKNTAVGGDVVGSSLRLASYTNNLLNQITGRDVPGYVNVLGSAKTNATVSLWSPQSTSLYATTTRKGEYYRGELPLNNSTGAVWMTITNLAVLNDGSNPDIVTNTTGNVFVPKTAEVFQYDRDGNLTNDGRWTYTWDAENRLTAMTSLSSAPAGSKRKLEFAYDSKGRRIQKIVSTWNGSSYAAQSTNRFVYDGWNLIAILNPQSSILQSFTWGLDLSGSLQGAGGVGGLLWIGDFASALGYHAAAYDGNGNLTALVKATDGAVTANYEYGPFGEALRLTGTMAKANPFRFSTKFQDDETDLVYYGYRSYNPSAGRWLNRDPIGNRGGPTLYMCNRNDMIGRFDLIGLKDYTFNFGIHQEPWDADSAQPMNGQIVLSEVDDSVVSIRFRVERPTTEENRELWATFRNDWRENVVVDGWLWPNLAALLSAHGQTGVTRYGGRDPSKQVDDDFAAVVVRREGGPRLPLISADWINENGVTSIRSISHAARIRGNFRLNVGSGSQCGSRDPINVWMTYADLLVEGRQMFDRAGWPREFNGATLVFVNIGWEITDDGFRPTFSTGGTSPPPPTGFGGLWATWAASGKRPRYTE